MPPQLEGIDHIHLYVSDREGAAAWYREVLGFTVNETLAVWAADPRGPLTIEDPTRKIHLALFEVDNLEPSTGIAFKANGSEFLAWKTYLEQQDILQRCTDHQLAWSLYFHDPDGNMHEITTYDHDHVGRKLAQPAA